MGCTFCRANLGVIPIGRRVVDGGVDINGSEVDLFMDAIVLEVEGVRFVDGNLVVVLSVVEGRAVGEMMFVACFVTTEIIFSNNDELLELKLMGNLSPYLRISRRQMLEALKPLFS